MSNGPYAGISATGTTWPQGKPTDPDEWSEDELDAWIGEQLGADPEFYLRWRYAEILPYPDGAAW